MSNGSSNYSNHHCNIGSAQITWGNKTFFAASPQSGPARIPLQYTRNKGMMIVKIFFNTFIIIFNTNSHTNSAATGNATKRGTSNIPALTAMP